MTIQDRYDKITCLLKTECESNSIVLNCLNASSSELTFSFFHEDNKVDKEHILQIYSSRAEFEDDFRPKLPYVLGYEELLPKLRTTDLKYINICNITTETGTFIIFTDYDYTEFIGILHSQNTLSEIRDKMKGSEYYSENVFFNGLHIIHPL